MPKLSRQCCCLLVVLLCSRAALGQPFPVRTVALSGEATPDASGETYASFPAFIPPMINSLGQVTFEAATNTGERVLVTENGGSPQVVFHTGAQVPGVEPGVNSFFLNGVAVNQSGDILFSPLFEGESINTTNDGGLFRWRVDDGALELLARKGDPAAGTTDGSLYGFFGNLRIDNDGEAGFSTPLQNPMNDTALYRTNSPPLLMDYTGNTTPDGGNVTEIRSFIKSLRSTWTTRTVERPSSTDDELVASFFPFAGEPTTATLKTGDPAVGYPTGTEIDFIGLTPGANDSGEAVFFATVKGASTGGGVWAWSPFSDPPALRLVAQEGQSLESPAGWKIDFIENVLINGNGRAAVVADIREVAGEGQAKGIWYEDEAGNLIAAAAIGQQAPDTPEGVNIASISWPSFNALGQLAFHAGLIGPEVDFSNDAAVFATDLNGDLHKVVRKGDMFDVNDDPTIEDMRTITTISSPANSGGEDGSGTSLNDAGQLTLALSFEGFTSGVSSFDTASFILPTGLPGDYNNDGKVDAADYVVWRKNEGAPAGTLRNDTAGGEIGAAQYELWVTNFGAPSNASGSSAAVPEPGACVLCLLTGAGLVFTARLRRGCNDVVSFLP